MIKFKISSVIIKITIGALLWIFLVDQANAKTELIVSYRTLLGGVTTSTYYDYYTALIKLALEKTTSDFGEYRMQGVETDGNIFRTLENITKNTYPNFLIELAYEEKLTDSGALTFIDVPIDGGIVGYRVCFVNPAIKQQLTMVTSLDQLQKYTIGQGIGWADSEILRVNHLNVVEISNYQSLFKMVAAGRIDLFCRGANQLKAEVEEFKSISHLTYDESLLLVYPLPRFFYLNSTNVDVKKRIEIGLKRSYKDGSIHRLWLQYYKENVEFSKLSGRKIIHLDNPLLKNLSMDYKQYFIDPLKMN